MKFCQQTTKDHLAVKTKPEVLKCIDQILKEEGCDLRPTPFEGLRIDIIDGDKLEELYSIQIGRGLHEKNKSMDIIFGLSTGNFQFVELKFKSKKNFRFLEKTSFQEKVVGSKEAMGNSASFYNSFALVFRQSIKSQAKHYLFRQRPILDSKFKVYDINELKIDFF